MQLSPAQNATLKTAILADQTLAPMVAISDWPAVADALNLVASPAFVVWRTSVARDVIQRDAGFNWTRVDNLNNGSKYRIWEWMFVTGSINPSAANVRAGIDATWVGTAADLAVRAVVYAHCKRSATKAEKILASGTGSDAVPATMGAEGALTGSDVQGAMA